MITIPIGAVLRTSPRQMKRKERLQVIIGLDLSLGVFAGVAGSIRSYYLQTLAQKSDYETIPITTLGTTELLICILCATIPVLRPLYKHLRGKSSLTDPSSTHGLSTGPMLITIGGGQIGSRYLQYASNADGTEDRSERGFAMDDLKPVAEEGKPRSSDRSDEEILGQGWRERQKRMRGQGHGITRSTKVDVRTETDGKDGLSSHQRSPTGW